MSSLPVPRNISMSKNRSGIPFVQARTPKTPARFPPFGVARSRGFEHPERQSAQAKYANPNDPDETWSGRGRKPRWIEAALNSGKSLVDLLI